MLHMLDTHRFHEMQPLSGIIGWMIAIQKGSLRFLPALCLLALAISLLGCSSPQPQPSPTSMPTRTSPATPLPSPTVTPTPLPSATPEPLAALVNGEPITLAEFQAELARFQAARQALPNAPAAPGTILATDTDVQNFVLDELVNQRLFAQAAYTSGFALSQETLQARLDQLVAQIGGQETLQTWLAENLYDENSFQAALARSIAVAWMRDQITAQLPIATEQIRVRQIMLYNLDQANQVLAALQSGQEFATLADSYDPLAGGDLGWFPRGYLTEPELETAAFQLDPGEYSEIIQTRLGYHILQVIERDPERALDPDARRVLQEKALQVWLAARRAESDIQTTLP